MQLIRRKKREDKAAAATLDLYYASDVHGSDQCWRKFLGAGRFYGVNGADHGRRPDGQGDRADHDGRRVVQAEFLGERQRGKGEADLEKLEGAIRYNGMYPWRAVAEEVSEAHGDAEIREQLFEQVIVDELRRWIDLADERMADYGIDVFVMPGNDDPWSCDPVIENAAHVQACDDRIVRVGDHEMISCAYANPTPWNSPRELDEDELYARIKRMAEQLESPETAIFNLHVPPYDSGLDTANEINPDLTVVFKSGQPNPIPVGSTAVRQLIEEYQPLLALHGHIHESRGEARIGRTLCINSGSEYNSGRIHGVTVKLAPDEVVSHQFVIG